MASRRLTVRKLIVTVGVVLIVVVGFGFWRGWINLSTSGDAESGSAGVNMSVDVDKIRGDAEDAKNRAKSAGDQVREKVSGSAPDASESSK